MRGFKKIELGKFKTLNRFCQLKGFGLSLMEIKGIYV
jgi:hypothetical protein